VALGTVLITGASTGIGEATTHHLKELGFDAVGRPQDAERLRSAGLRTVTLDVTDRESIAAAGAAWATARSRGS
jgi:NADP-dependent 3-hydroxy acid dehydrogenase YdfG